MSLGIIGLVIAILALAYLGYKGWTPLVLALAATIIVLITNQMNFWDTINIDLQSAIGDFIGSYLIMICLGATYGKIMERTGTAKVIAMTLLSWFGKSKAVLAILVTTSILTYAGVSIFIIVFTVYPFAVYMFKESNTPREFMPALIFLGGSTYTLALVPGAPSIMNILASNSLGTTLYSAPVIGISMTIFVAVAGYFYLVISIKKAQAKGAGFLPKEGEVIEDMSNYKEEDLPPVSFGFIAIILVIVCIAVYSQFLTTSDARNLALLTSSLFMLITNAQRLKRKNCTVKSIVTAGVTSAYPVVFSVAILVGFGSVITASPAFQTYIAGLGNVLVSGIGAFAACAIFVAALTGICASSINGIAIFFTTFGDSLISAGVSAAALHRVALLAAISFDSLPHCGPVMALIHECGVTHKTAYKHIFVVSVLITSIATCIGVVMANIGLC